MKATIITIGDEILIGQIVDTNSGFIAKALDKIGIEVAEMRSISDNKQHILDTFREFQDRCDIVLITGGLGPTKDDITKKTLCEYFDDELVIDQGVLEHVTRLIHNFTGNTNPLLQTNIDQALVPSKATVLFNQYGTAPGIWIKKGSTIFVSMPGVPYEMKRLIENEIIPKIVMEFRRPYIIHKTIMTYGMGESMVADKIADWENNLPEFIKLAYLPSPGRVRLRLSARGTDKEMLETAIAQNVSSLTEIIGDIIVGFEEDETIEVMLGKLLTENKCTVSTAESCTGGKIAQMLASVPGASAYFRGSIVAYSEQVKIDVLSIEEHLISQFSVVSKEVAEQMALNVKRVMNTDYAIATTGNAGPTRDKTDKNLGVVYIAFALPDDTVVSYEFNFGQPREKVIDRAVNKSFELLQAAILGNAGR
ncbi:MAG: damage-inducible protein CinA [Flavobacterium sp. BFFFF1]|uniref:CinA family nicotinamide mononucleotide deamidase-related protein n=1 Tax=Flavobacterium sp. BFFFF1 TaxID=2015557 RepID=UPI000BDAC887|nr:CinA family nicotinamide mononucleotide deamidase-related protein [Flavobacterium sp. BFFFF1]OYU82060.1 MAG: damage-inducible protein CinA [Flavobacterium sp. BFFFF1]